MSRERTARLARLAALQAEVRARADLNAQTQREQLRQLEDDEVAIVEALGTDSALHGAFVGLVASAAQRVVVEKARTAEALEAAKRAAATEEVRERIMKKRVAMMQREVERRRERDILIDIALAPKRRRD